MFFGNRSGCSTKGSCVDQINGGSTAVLNGALYFPSDEIEITGSNASGYTMLVADKIYINGNSTFANNGNPFDGITVSVSPATATLFAAQTQQFTAAVTNSANSAVTWTITPAGVGSISSTGLYTAPSSISAAQTVTVTASSQADNSKSGSATVALAVTKSAQTIAFNTIAAQTVGTPLTLVATASSGLAVSFTSTTQSICTVSGATTTFLASGTCTIDANQSGNSTYAAAAMVAQSFPVNGEAQTIAFNTIAAQTVGTPLTLVATASSGLAVSFTSTTPSICTVSGATTTSLASGTCTIDANQSGNSTYAAAAMVAQSFPVNGEAQTIAFNTIAAQTVGTPLTLVATASSGLAVSFASTTQSICTVSGATTTFLASGTCTIDANQSGNSTYAAAAMVAQSFTVNGEAQTITFGTIAAQTVGTPLTLLATASSGLAVSFTSATQSICTVSGATTTFLASGTCTIDANQSGNSTYAAAPMVAQSFPVNGEAQTITFNTIAAQTVGTPLTLVATASSGLAVSFTSTTQSICTVSGATTTFLASGTCTIDANQSGNSTYAAAMVATSFPVTQTQCTSNKYGYQRVITIDHTQVPNTNQTNFPFLFNTTDPLLATTANGGHVSSPNGYDIIFTSDSAGQNVLNSEIEKYNPVNGQLVSWVQIPTLSHTSDTEIYVFYGNSSITSSQQNPTAVWDSDYLGVWHTGETTGSTIYDSTYNVLNGSAINLVPEEGQIDGAQIFGDQSSYINEPSGFSDFINGFTFELWANPSEVQSYARFMDFSNGPGEDNIVLAREGTSNYLVFGILECRK